MKKIISLFDHKAFIRISVLMLCMIFAFTFIAKPFNVSANTAAATYVVTYLGEAVAVSAPALTVLLPVIGLGICTVSLYAAVEVTYDMLSSEEIIANWANTMSTGISEGMVVTIPPEVQEYLKKKAEANGQQPPDKIPLMVIPSNFTSLDSISLDELFNTQSDSALQEENNALVREGNGILSRVLTAIKALPETLLNGMHQIKVELQEWVGNVNDTTSGFLRSIADWGGAINSGISKWGRDAVDWLKNINSNLGYHTNQLFGNIKSWFNSSVGIFSGSMDSAQAEEDALEEETDEGKQKIPLIIGKSKDLLSRYDSAFFLVGAVLTSFLNIEFINNIVTFSLALGIFALIANLANTFVSKNGNSAKGKSAAKRGG